MLHVVLLVLALCAIAVLANQFLVGVVLAGLLALLASALFTIRELQSRLERLEDRLHADRPETEAAPAGPAPSWAPPATAPEKPAPARPAAAPSREETAQAASRARPEPAAPVERREPAPPPGGSGRQGSEPEPQEPSKAAILAGRLLRAVRDWFTGGNVFVRVGVVILFIGMTFLVRYAVGENMIPIGLSLAGVAAAAVGLLYWGWRQRTGKPVFSMVIQGGGIGLLYLTVFASFSLYKVIPSLPAFALLAATVVLTAVLAVLQNARSLAIFATVGGFLAPVLTSSGSNNYIGLFSYYTLLNLGVFAIAWFRSWRLLNLLGFVFTFGVSTAWGVLSYEPDFFATTEPFLVTFFLLYVVIGILFANRQTPFYKDYVDSSLVFGTPLLAFGLQCAIVKDYAYGVAISAAVLGTFYILLTRVLWKRYGESLRLLSETFLSLGVVFLTLAIPFAIDGTLTGATWAIEGAGILWVSIRQQQKYRRLFGQALVFLAGAILGYELLRPVPGADSLFRFAFLNSGFIGCVIIALSAGACGWLMSRPFPGRLPAEEKMQYALPVYGVAALLAGFEYQVFDFHLYAAHGTLLAVLSAVCITVYTLAAVRLQWKQAHWTAVAFVAPVAAAAILCYAYQPQLASHYGYLVWPLTLSAYFIALKRARGAVRADLFIAAHLCIAAVLVALLLWEGLWQLLLAYTVLAVVFDQAGKKWDWPQLKMLAVGLLPVHVLVAAVAIGMDGNLVDLSSIAAGTEWAFPPGYLLWPLAFVAYFSVLYRNRQMPGLPVTALHHAGAGLIGGLLLWLGLWPLLLGAALLAPLCCVLWQRLSWPEMRVNALALLPAMLTVLFIKFLGVDAHPFNLQAFNIDYQPPFEPGFVLWPLAFAALFWTFHRFDLREQPAPGVQHGLALLAPAWLITWEASWHVLDHVAFMNGWHLALLPLTSLLALRLIRVPPAWPFTAHREAFHRVAVIPLVLALTGWSLLQLFSPAPSEPLPWLPLVNPVDVVQAVVVMAALTLTGPMLAGFENPPSKRDVRIAVAAFVFVWANAELLRAVHHWGGVPWEMPVLLTADLSQTALSLFWALCGLGLTFYAGRRSMRKLWLFGAALLAVVILKLFLIDLSATGTVERIVSFTGVGLLLVLVGYFSPLPPRTVAPAAEEAR